MRTDVILVILAQDTCVCQSHVFHQLLATFVVVLRYWSLLIHALLKARMQYSILCSLSWYTVSIKSCLSGGFSYLFCGVAMVKEAFSIKPCFSVLYLFDCRSLDQIPTMLTKDRRGEEIDDSRSRFIAGSHQQVSLLGQDVWFCGNSWRSSWFSSTKRGTKSLFEAIRWVYYGKFVFVCYYHVLSVPAAGP